jgi:hypothetical protein
MFSSMRSVQNFLQIPFIANRLFHTAEDKIGTGELIGHVLSQSIELVADNCP